MDDDKHRAVSGGEKVGAGLVLVGGQIVFILFGLCEEGRWSGFCRGVLRGSRDHRSQDPQLVGDFSCSAVSGVGWRFPLHIAQELSKCNEHFHTPKGGVGKGVMPGVENPGIGRR